MRYKWGVEGDGEVCGEHSGNVDAPMHFSKAGTRCKYSHKAHVVINEVGLGNLVSPLLIRAED